MTPMETLRYHTRLHGVSHLVLFATLALVAVRAAGVGGALLPAFDGTSGWGNALLGAAVISALVLATSRTTWLPFLGPSVFPLPAVRQSVPENPELTVQVPISPEAVAVVYWAAEGGDDKGAADPASAYGSFANSGAIMTSGAATVTLPLKCPRRYKVGSGKKLPRHVHYREVYASGVLGEIKTWKTKC